MWFPLSQPHESTKNTAGNVRPPCKRMERLAKLNSSMQSASERGVKASSVKQSKYVDNCSKQQPQAALRRASIESKRSVEIQSEDFAVTIKDLCEVDKQRIAELIREIAKMTTEKHALESAVDSERTSRREEVEQVRSKLNDLERDRHTLQHQVTEYQRLLCDSQKQVFAHFSNEQALTLRINELMAQLRLRSQSRTDLDAQNSAAAKGDREQDAKERRRRSKSASKHATHSRLDVSCSPKRDRERDRSLRLASSSPKRTSPKRRSRQHASTNTSFTIAEHPALLKRTDTDRWVRGHSFPNAPAFTSAITSSPRTHKSAHAASLTMDPHHVSSSSSAFALRDALAAHRMPPRAAVSLVARHNDLPAQPELHKYSNFDTELLDSLISDAEANAVRHDHDGVVSDCFSPFDRDDRGPLALDCEDDELLSDLFFID